MRSATLAGLVLFTFSAAPVLALECPVSTQFDDATTAAAVAKILPPGIDLEAPQALQSAIFDLRQAGVSDDLILDNLIAIHCATVVADPGLSDAQKTKRVVDFPTTAEPLVIGGSN